MLAGALAILTAGAGYTSILVAQQQNTSSEATRYNVTWLVSQAGVELARLQATVGGATLPGSAIGPDDVQLRFDILSSRLQLLQSGDVDEFIRSDAEFGTIVGQFKDVLGHSQPLVESIENPVIASQLFDLLAPLNAKVARLASAANIRSGDHVAAFQVKLNVLYKLFQAVLAGLVACGIGLIVSLRSQNGSLRRAYAVAETMGTNLRQAGERFDAALSNMAQGLCLFDAKGTLIIHNQCFVRMFGEPTAGATAASLGRDRERAGLFAPPGIDDSDADDHRTHELSDGRVIQVSRQAIAGEGWVATYEDITERRRSQERLSHMARHDPLTGLPNRLMFREHMERVLPRRRRGDHLAVLCLDLDGFKGVNDTLGHPAGDELLRLVSRRLRDCVRETDLVSRLGGDEFAIVQVEAERADDAATLADRLVETLRTPFDLLGQRISIGTSIGVVLADDAGNTADELLRNADIALYRAKAEGRGTWRFFAAEMDVEIQRRHKLEADLRFAIEDQQFEVCYQPLIDTRSQALSGFEALIRWNHPERGVISPAEFIPLAEEVGLIKSIGAWVLGRACNDATSWPDHVKIAVNLSPLQFLGGDLVRMVAQALESTGLRPGRLELEITESVLLQDNEATLSVLHSLHAIGVRISMDDFGTGYSSLSYLRRFPFDKIKIDQSFVRNLNREKGSIEIVRAVVGLGKALGMDVLAEGVETLEQLNILELEGCDELQGYLFSKPQPLARVFGIIADYARLELDRRGATQSDPATAPAAGFQPEPQHLVALVGG